MSNIPISQIVQINPRVVGAGGEQGALDGLLLTKNDALPADAPFTFYAAADVAEFFGYESPEYAAAQVYFAGIVGGGKQPGALFFARYVEDAMPATVFGAGLQLTLAQLQALSGTLIVETSTTSTSSTIDMAASTSFADAATRMEAAFAAPDFTIRWDAVRARFVIETTSLGLSATIGAVTGTLATVLGLSDAAGAYVQQTGAPADTPSSAMDRIVGGTTNWFSFSHAWEAQVAERLLFAEWNSAQNSAYTYVGYGLEPDALTPDSSGSFGAVVRDTPYRGTLPVYGELTEAAATMAWAAAVNFDVVEGRATLAFRQPVAALTPRVKKLSHANALLSNGFTYYGQYAAAAETYTVFYNGAVGGEYLWADTYLNQSWLRRSLQQALFETLLAYNSLPYNAEGYAAVYQGAQGVVAQAVAAGVVRPGVTLSASQQAQINAQAGKPVAGEVQNQGWHMQVADPLNTATRAQRGSPVVNFWYSDGGSIQKLVVSSTTVL